MAIAAVERGPQREGSRRPIERDHRRPEAGRQMDRRRVHRNQRSAPLQHMRKLRQRKLAAQRNAGLARRSAGREDRIYHRRIRRCR